MIMMVMIMILMMMVMIGDDNENDECSSVSRRCRRRCRLLTHRPGGKLREQAHAALQAELLVLLPLLLLYLATHAGGGRGEGGRKCSCCRIAGAEDTPSAHYV